MLQPQSQSSAAQKQRLSRKVCAILNCWRKNPYDNYEYNFYIVERDSFSSGDDEYPHTKPTIRFKLSYSDVVAFSTLYMFEGYGLIYSEGEATFEGRFAGKFEITL